MAVDRFTTDQTGQFLGFCLLGKLVSHRSLAAEVMRKTFQAAWRTNNGLQVNLLGKNLFLFRLVNEEERLQVDRGHNSPPQYGEWLRFGGRGGGLARVPERAEERDSERLELMNHPISVAGPVAMVSEDLERLFGATERSLSPTRFSLSGGSVFVSKGKEKVSEMAVRFWGGSPAFARSWRAECSSDGRIPVTEPTPPVQLLQTDVSGLDFNSAINMKASVDEEVDLNNDREWEECNKRLNENLMALINSSSSGSKQLSTFNESPAEIEGMNDTVQDGKLIEKEDQPSSIKFRRQVKAEDGPYANQIRPNVEILEDGLSKAIQLPNCVDSPKVVVHSFVMGTSKGPKWKKRARASYVPIGMTIKDIKEFNKRRDGLILLSPEII